MPRTFGSLSAYEPGLMDQARWWLQDKLTPVMGGDARRAGDFVQNKVMPTAEYLPGVGDAMAAGEAVDYFKQGQPIFGTLAAAGAAAGLVPGVGDAMQKGIKAAVKSRGDEVLGLIKAGRASEVTDDMLDMGNAADNANLNAYLFENYDLPMDEASRMGRAQEIGFGDDTYHGTMKDFPAFSKEGDGVELNFGENQFNLGHFLTNDPRYAGQYAVPAYNGQPGGPNILPVRTNANLAQRDAALIDDIETNWTGKQSADLVNELSKDGFGGIDFGAVRYRGQVPTNEVAVFNPTDIRSRFARFDPRLKHLRNLSAGLAPFGALSMFNAYQDDNYQPPQL